MINRDFYEKLNEATKRILDYIVEQFSDQSWFDTVWEDYRNHVLNSNPNEVREPGVFFNLYICNK